MANNMSMNFPPFDPDVDQTTAGNRFKKYVDRFGKLDVVIESKTKLAPATFYVVKGKTKTEPLLSYKTAQELGMVTVANTVETEPSRVEELLEKYSNTFEGIGKMKGVKVDLNIDTDVRPTVQPLRRIPFSVRPKIEEEIRRLEKEDIIERIDKPTSWVSPTVITPKKNPNEVRLNVDMRVANGAIPRVNSITPTIDELIQELNEAEVFSHLDMNHGYHQLELDENSRDITTFSTHIGFYRYSQIELETLAVDFACKKFHLYLYGIPFTIVTDHKPLESFINNPRHQTSIRLQRILVRFMKNFASSTEKLRNLLKESRFRWEKEHQEAFENLKRGLCEETTLTYFDPKAEHEVHVDGCPLGISATLVQKSVKNGLWQVVQYASRSLSDTETRNNDLPGKEYLLETQNIRTSLCSIGKDF